MIHSLKLTWPLKIGHCRRKFVFEPLIFRGYVCCWEGIPSGFQHKTQPIHNPLSKRDAHNGVKFTPFHGHRGEVIHNNEIVSCCMCCPAEIWGVLHVLLSTTGSRTGISIITCISKKQYTLAETNIAPENGFLECYFPFGNLHFQVLR